MTDCPPFARPGDRRAFALAKSLLSATVLLVAAPLGCGPSAPGGGIDAISLNRDAVRLPLAFEDGVYTLESDDASLYVSDRSLEQLLGTDRIDAAVLHAQVLWRPRPGRTPVDATATNITLRLFVSIEGESALFGGAGFGWPRGRAGTDDVSINIVAATLSLLESTAGFRDLLSPLTIAGRIGGRFDPREAVRFRQAVSQRAADAFGRAMWVHSDDADDDAHAVTRRVATEPRPLP